ncbi:hypothetical protein [Streptomyces sp. NPDC020597]|uniref:hypothetical protein n=1 Tax=unclassified Streptomyces TaxID=2593676 RepID=UPI00378D41FF
MRWLMLYARSRQVPASLAALVIGTVTLWALAGDDGQGPADPRLPVLILAMGAMAASTGLSGQDLPLDRTAAIRWAPRRAAHVLLAGAVVGAAFLTAQTMGEHRAAAVFVVRDSAGLMGLAALGAALAGGRYAWTLPFAWLAVAFFAPSDAGTPTQVATWMLLPAGTAAATWTALLLTLAGTAAYAFAGPRR